MMNRAIARKRQRLYRGLACAACLTWALAGCAEEWAYDECLTLGTEVRQVQTQQGPSAQLTASASVAREVVERWTDEAMRGGAPGGVGPDKTPGTRGYRVRIEVLQGGKPVGSARVVPGTGPLGDWVGVIPCEVGDRVIWKRRAVTKVTVLHPHGQLSAEYSITWYVNCRAVRTALVTLPSGQERGAKAAPKDAEAISTTGPRTKDVTVTASPPTAGSAAAGATGKIASAVLCQEVDERNQPIGASESFAGDVQVITLLIAHKLPQGVGGQIRVGLFHEGEKKAGHLVDVEGEGKFVIEYRPGPSGRFRPGQWTVRVEADGRLDRELAFTVAE